MSKVKIILTTIAILIALGLSYFTYQIFFGGFTFLDSDVVEIAFSENISSYNPHTFTESNDQRLRYIYEPLVQFDNDLNIKPRLVSSFGQLEPNIWEFKLKRNVSFHDGQKLTSDIVKSSLLRSKNIPAMSALTDSILEIEIVDDLTFKIITPVSDNLLLSKLTHLFVTPTNYSLEDLANDPVGTGQYQVKKIYRNELHLIGFEQYHGALPDFPKLIISYIEDQVDRVNAINFQENLLIVHTVPVSFVDKVDQSKFSIKSTPNNSVNFFLFNFNRSLLKDLKKRVFLLSIFDDTTILRITDNQAKPTDQFVGSGVFGYNGEIFTENFASNDLAIKAAQRSGIMGSAITVAISKDLEVFKEVVEKRFFDVGVLPKVTLLDSVDLTNPEVLQDFDMIFMGWKSDSGDAVSFFENIAASNGGLNIGHYKNSRVDSLLKQIKTEPNELARRDLLMQAMQIVSIVDPIGIPLFEGVNIYGVNNAYDYTQRLDGFIDINNLSKK